MLKLKAILCDFIKGIIKTEDSDEARLLYDQSRFGTIDSGCVMLSFLETYYLLEKEKIILYDYRRKKITKTDFLKKAQRKQNDFWVRYCVFRDLRERGYIVKTALKFGADFRVYDRGVKPGDDHAKWVVYPVHETDVMTWYEFSAKNRVAHSTKKRLLLGIVDEEGDVSYWETRWLRP
ncbi:tRNA-intron lyase [Candidatus Woesearchaeota archaeon CG10_big_fil_rev_8_21_14_0_10_34_8]|nr:MAG: tRNA-intron lyase [Candidatus Woesearchaeota archaeon CG10_big_fil_rev_8_21_14_0_10_34_8]